MTKALLLAVLLVAACADEGAAPAANEDRPASRPSIDPTAKAKVVKENDDLLEFSYAWPTEAATIPALNARLEGELARDRAEAFATAREDQASRTADAPYHGHYFSKKWRRFGESHRLLSLAAEISTFTGGAHGNSGFDQIIWDKDTGKAVAPADLFADPAAAMAALGRDFCAGLDAERAGKRREALPLTGEGWMVECPALADQALVPVDQDGDGRFERLRVLVAPYEAGPYAEGSYTVDLPVGPALPAMVKPGYRDGFAQPQ